MSCWLFLLMMISSNECHGSLLMINQHWWYWFGVVRQDAIFWANLDPDGCRNLPGHNELKYCGQKTMADLLYTHFCIRVLQFDSRIATIFFLSGKLAMVIIRSGHHWRGIDCKFLPEPTTSNFVNVIFHDELSPPDHQRLHMYTVFRVEVLFIGWYS